MYRQGRNYENLNRAILPGVGAYDIPQLFPTTAEAVAEKFIGFNYAKSCREPESCGVHFFVDDYQFSRLWSNPDAYLDMLSRFRCLCTPDFSTYTDFPKAIQIYNHYRKHWLGAYWQAKGLLVIPTVSWSDEESFEWCFDGEPEGGVVAVSSVGTQMIDTTKRLFHEGFHEMIARLKPSAILFYGIVPEGCEVNGIVRLPVFQNELRKRIERSK